jgi:hypothetical protein
VRNKSYRVIETYFKLQRPVPWLSSRQPLAAEIRVRSQVSPFDICGGQSGTGSGSSPQYSGFPLSLSFHQCSIIRLLSQHFSFPLSVSFHQCSIIICILVLLLPGGQAGEAWEPTMQRCFRCGATERKYADVVLAVGLSQYQAQRLQHCVQGWGRSLWAGHMLRRAHKCLPGKGCRPDPLNGADNTAYQQRDNRR